MQKDKIRSGFNAIIMKIKSYPRTEFLFLLVIASIFMPFLLTGVALVGFCIYVLVKKQLLLGMLKTKYSFLLVVFGVLAVTVPLFFKWWIGSIAGVLLIFGLIFFLTAQSIMTEKLYNKAFDICCIMSLVCFVYAVIQKLVNGIGFRSTGGLLNANYYATVIEFVVLICVYRMLTQPKAYKRYILFIAINIAGLFLCDCQSAWIPIAFGVLVLLYFNGYKKHAIVFFFVAIVLAIIFVTVPGILPRLDRLPQTFQTRIDIWKTSIEGFRQHPIFGRGALGYMTIFEQFGGYKTYHSHSLYLDPLLSHGIVGTFLVLGYIFLNILNLHKAKFGKNSGAIKSIMIASVFAVCIHGITDYTIFWLQTGMLFCLIMSGIGIAKRTEMVEE